MTCPHPSCLYAVPPYLRRTSSGTSRPLGARAPPHQRSTTTGQQAQRVQRCHVSIALERPSSSLWKDPAAGITWQSLRGCLQHLGAIHPFILQRRSNQMCRRCEVNHPLSRIHPSGHPMRVGPPLTWRPASPALSCGGEAAEKAQPAGLQPKGDVPCAFHKQRCTAMRSGAPHIKLAQTLHPTPTSTDSQGPAAAAGSAHAAAVGREGCGARAAGKAGTSGDVGGADVLAAL